MSVRRRAFIKSVPTLAASAVMHPSPMSAQAPPSAPPEIITADGLGAAQYIIGVNLPLAERESARSIVIRNRENYDAIRKVTIPSETEPAFSFRPPRPLRTTAATSTSNLRGMGTAAATRRFGSIGELAFEPVSTLAALLAARRITSIDLTSMYLERLKQH